MSVRMTRFVIPLNKYSLGLRYSDANGWHISPPNGVKAPDKPIPVISADGKAVVGEARASSKLGDAFLVAAIGVTHADEDVSQEAETSATLVSDSVLQYATLDIDPMGGSEEDIISSDDVRRLWEQSGYQPEQDDWRSLEKLTATPISILAGYVKAVRLQSLPFGAHRIHYGNTFNPEADAQEAINKSARRGLGMIFKMAEGAWLDVPVLSPAEILSKHSIVYR